MKTKILLLIANIMIFAMPLLAIPPAEPDIVLEWQKDIFPTEINFSKFSVDGKYIYFSVYNADTFLRVLANPSKIGKWKGVLYEFCL